MTSIHELPVELLLRIFEFGMLDARPAMSSTSPFPAEPPFEVLVSHVCPHWRAIALHAPALWTHIAIAIVPHVARAREYIARSARQPLRILVDSVAEADAVPGFTIFRAEFLPAFAVLTPPIHRWAALALRVRDLTCKAAARKVLSSCGPAPLLDSLELWHIQDWRTPEGLFNAIGPPPVVVFNGALPALARLSLIGVNIQWQASSSPFLRDLTDLELGIHSDNVRIPFPRWAEVLAAPPRLRRLLLHYSGPRAALPWDTRPRGGPIPLPALAELRLVDLDPPYVCALLRTLHAPALRALFLELDTRDADPEPAQDFSALADMLACAPAPEPALVDPAARYAPPPCPIDDPHHALADPHHALAGPHHATGSHHVCTPLFPRLESLAIRALAVCAPASWARLLRRLHALRTLEADFDGLHPGAFDVLLPAPRPAVNGRRIPGQGQGEGEGEGEGEGDGEGDGDGEGEGESEGEGEGGREGQPGDTEQQAQAHGHSTAAADVVLPALHTLRVANVSGARLAALARYRRAAGRPIARWYVAEGSRDADAERLKAEMDRRRGEGAGEGEGEGERMEWFRMDEDEGDEGSEGSEEEEGEEGWGDEEHEGEGEGEGEGGGGEEAEGGPAASSDSDDQH
ncbi:hypothetical protein IEO21_04227 [Rhodonia placenta]|uniref:F-box domain-containing protein n=1 Tax=Rhodonia placenta TaxID=104341 RepID=A0A8H7P4Q1_9APHY|nr:hypothetical protein IEO21_04227 [Postia placenta]